MLRGTQALAEMVVEVDCADAAAGVCGLAPGVARLRDALLAAAQDSQQVGAAVEAAMEDGDAVAEGQPAPEFWGQLESAVSAVLLWAQAVKAAAEAARATPGQLLLHCSSLNMLAIRTEGADASA
jgi:hypothetical protein